MEKFSYSKLNTYETCAWRYKLTYVDKHFINDANIANDLGTLVHYIEESIAREIVKNNGESVFGIDYNYFTNLFINIFKETQKTATQKEIINGVLKLKEKYPDRFYEKDKNNLSCAKKCEIYANESIYRLGEFLSNNRDLEIVGIEQPFNLDYRGYNFHGFIDRVFRNKKTGQIIIEDIKTYSAPVEDQKLKTPLQFVFYTLAAREIYNTDDIICFYDLPFCNIKQQAGSSGYMNRGIKKINKILDSIEKADFTPNPSPLCHWCPFSATYPDQPEEAKGLCPYFCKWTRDKKDFSVNHEWMGIENNAAIIEAFNNKINGQSQPKVEIDPVIELFNDNNRKFFIRR